MSRDWAATRTDARAGFTLLEVVAALAILMVFLVPALGAVSGGIRNVDSIRNRSLALLLAQNKMAEIEMLEIPDSEGSEDGNFGRDFPEYSWRLDVIKTPDLQLMENAIPTIQGMEIHLHVFYEEDQTLKSVTLSSILLGDRK